MLIELSDDQIETILSSMDSCIEEYGYSKDVILIARYLRDCYGASLEHYINLKCYDDSVYQEPYKVIETQYTYEPLFDKSGKVIAWMKIIKAEEEVEKDNG